MAVMNQVRGFLYVAGVLKSQTADSLCRECNSFATVHGALKDAVAAFAPQTGASEEAAGLLARAKAAVAELRPPAQPKKQKKEGNCKLPEGVCFVKYSLGILQKVQPAQ